MMNKRGLSEVVTAVLLVLLAIAAVVIVWSVIKGFLQAPGGTADCMNINLEIRNIDKTVNSVKVFRNTNTGGNPTLNKIKFLFENSTGSKAIDQSGDMPNILETKTYIFTTAQVNIATEAYTKVSAYAVINSEKGDQPCPTIAAEKTF
jgi:flagellin-like protein